MTTYTSTLEPSMVKNLRFGLESKNKLSKKDYRFGLKNKCVPGSSADEICDDNDVKPVDPIIEHSGDCYTAIQTEANKTNTFPTVSSNEQQYETFEFSEYSFPDKWHGKNSLLLSFPFSMFP